MTRQPTFRARLSRLIALLALPLAVSTAAACTSVSRPVLRQPQDSVNAMRDAYDKDDAGLFLHTLSRPVLSEYSEHILRVGWSDIRPNVGDFVTQAQVVSDTEYRLPRAEPDVPRGFVMPEQDAPLRAVRLRVGDKQENFLFQLEVDPPAEDSAQARGFWIGDRYFVRTEHASPQTYLVKDSPESERTHWRLVFPYYPFQAQGELTRALQERLNASE